MDNNRCEQTMRPEALGRKAWLFAGSQRAGERLADLMSLVETARAGKKRRAAGYPVPAPGSPATDEKQNGPH